MKLKGPRRLNHFRRRLNTYREYQKSNIRANSWKYWNMELDEMIDELKKWKT